MISRHTAVLALALPLLGLSAPCIAQVHKVSSDDIMDAALDMKRAAELADRLAPEGAKYCRWGIGSLDASDLDVVISRFLLNHGTRVPDYVPASRMWHVSFVVGDMVHQLAMGEAECDVNLRYSDNARSVSVSATSILTKLMLARSRFEQLAYQQTEWQEDSNLQNRGEVYNRGSQDTGQVVPSNVLSAARDLKRASEVAARVAAGAAKTKGCVHTDSAIKAPELTYLAKLLDYLERTPRSPGYIPAANMWAVNSEAIPVQLDVLTTIGSCTANAGEKKQARNMATEALQAYHQVTAAIAAFDSLALQQTEWEERNAQTQPAMQEQ